MAVRESTISIRVLLDNCQEQTVPVEDVALIVKAPDEQVLIWLEDSPPEGGDLPIVRSTAVAEKILEGTTFPIITRPSSSASFEILVNPAAGASRAVDYADHVLKPLLHLVGIKANVYKTQRSGQLPEELDTSSVIVACGGDGTTHDLLNAVLAKAATPPALSLALVPLGTANALDASLSPPRIPHRPVHKLHSLISALTQIEPRSLPIASVKTSAPTRQIFAHVVASFALHASILYDADRMKISDPSLGIERFGLAFRQNMNNLYRGAITLKGPVQRYSPQHKTFESTDLVTVGGPFSYCVTSLVDRFEPNLIVAPLRRPESGADSGSIDVVVIKPRQVDGLPKVDLKGLETITQAMYAGGKHIDLVYADKKIVTVDDHPNGQPAVDYFRCTGVMWKPDDGADQRSRLVCIDGLLVELEDGGTASVNVVPSDSIKVYA